MDNRDGRDILSANHVPRHRGTVVDDSMKIDTGSTVQVFPQPIVRAAFPPNRCQCTWAYSPKTYGTEREPHVLKVVWALCPVVGHNTPTSIGLTVGQTVKERVDNGAREKGKRNQGNDGEEKPGHIPPGKRSNQTRESGKGARGERRGRPAKRQGKRQQEVVEVEGERL